tara:strand:+ start:1646 stop:2230 length:585 start_codon:yes stop_codon:yes gene_type:complete
MKFEIIKYKKVTSTNDTAINLIKKRNKKIGFVIAENQTKGRGTKGKKWISKKGNLFCSLFFPLKGNLPPFNEFSIISPVIVSDVIKIFCEDDNVNLKFPNDIFLNGKKICGILQEVVTIDNVKFLITGVGMNISSSPNINSLYKTTNFLSETKKSPEINKVIKVMIKSYEKFFINLKNYNYEKFKERANLLAIN